MLEVRYDLETGKVTGWCGDPEQFGNLPFRPGEEVALIDDAIPVIPGEYVLEKGKLRLTKPAVRRNWKAEYAGKTLIEDQIDLIAERVGLK